MKKMLIPIIIELVGIAAIGAGIGVEIALGADLGWALMSGGSVIVAAGGIIWGKFIKR